LVRGLKPHVEGVRFTSLRVKEVGIFFLEVSEGGTRVDFRREDVDAKV